ncbi:MAG: 2-phospho-L-lactate guanylyltransferase [Burkholderiaceae bacterium]|nr:2-phospho-L-lactate guanylyltransferase [Burkholderiaceae bacterium]
MHSLKPPAWRRSSRVDINFIMARLPHVVIPVKPLTQGKSRLADLLGDSARTTLNRQLLARTLDRAAVYPGADRSLVVSRCVEVLSIARERGFHVLSEPADDGLNLAARRGTYWALEAGATAMLVMPVDLPLGNAENLRALVDGAPSDEPVCVLVPDQHGRGTNLLYQSPLALFSYAFGPDSLMRHSLLAERHLLRPVLLGHSCFGFDIDEPADYKRWRLACDSAANADRPESEAALPCS